jgi:cytochrome b6-f complex iron-sulfur subunit
MATKELVTKVWIAPGCIVCDACETTAPDVFEVQHDNETCIIRPDALNMEFTKPRTKTIIEAAEECPVDVIKFDLVPVEVSDAEAAAEAASPPAAKPEKAVHAEAAPHAATAKASPAKPAEPPKPKVLDPAIQALLAATTARGGNVVINRDVKGMPDAVKQLAKLSPDQLPPDARFQKVLEKAKPTKEEPTRRDLILGAGWAAIAISFGAAPLVAFNRFMAPNVLEMEDPKVRCGPISKFQAMAPGDVDEQFKPVKPSGFWIIREEERIGALSIICTHLGCIPSWLPNDRKFKCPCHGSGFKPNGTNFEGPAPRPLERFKIYLDGEEVIVDRSRKFLAMGPNDTAVWNDPDASIPV